ncbi:hypothetical protein KUTeg_013422 [Tegillarca granosa]|uniref:Uncharacterized protein n=1 Tax=Tegillarca granosa TaxID=220873 RepID=A0ABQ9EZ15_TEGGR|nr:hypothetical protein KUTeg_013422 [Tegillarca granosa]
MFIFNYFYFAALLEVQTDWVDWFNILYHNRGYYVVYCYYPLYPPSEDVNVDYESFEKYGHMPVTPHVLIVPSDLKHFIKVSHVSCIALYRQ